MNVRVKGDPCKCPDHPCENLTAEPKWVRCRPCAIGNHFGGICRDFRQMRTDPNQCVVCGYDRVDHVATK